MSTAHRPTWNPAHGGDSQSGNRFLAPRTAFSVKDLPRHLTVKHRQPSQRPLSAEELKRKLEEREQQHAAGGAGGVAKVPRFDAKPAAEQLLDFSALDGAPPRAHAAPRIRAPPPQPRLSCCPLMHTDP